MHNWIDYINALSTFVIAIFTVFMWRAVHNQRESMEHSERAWIMVELKPRVEEADRVNVRSVNLDRTGIDVTIVCENHGRTPAWITEKKIDLKIFTVLPDEPQLEGLELFQYGIEPIAPEGNSKQVATLECGGHPDVGKITLIFGSVKYLDIFDRKRETRFAYKVLPSNQLERLAARGYNRAT